MPTTSEAITSNLDLSRQILLLADPRSRHNAMCASTALCTTYRSRVAGNCSLSHCWPEHINAVKLMCATHWDCFVDPFDVERVANMWRDGKIPLCERNAFIRNKPIRVPALGFVISPNCRKDFSKIMEKVAHILGIALPSLKRVQTSNELFPLPSSHRIFCGWEDMGFPRGRTPSSQLIELMASMVRDTLFDISWVHPSTLPWEEFMHKIATEHMDAFMSNAQLLEQVLEFFPWFDFTDTIKQVVTDEGNPK